MLVDYIVLWARVRMVLFISEFMLGLLLFYQLSKKIVKT